MPDPRDDLWATAESIKSDAGRGMAPEDEKSALDPADPRVEHRSEQVEQLAGRLADKTEVEHSLSKEIKRQK